MSELGLLGAEVLDVARVRRHFQRGARHHVDAVALEAAVTALEMVALLRTVQKY